MAKYDKADIERRMLGAVEAQVRRSHRRVDEGAVVRPVAVTHVRPKVDAGDTHAVHRDLPLLLQRANHLHEGGEQGGLLDEGQCADGLREELRPRARLHGEAAAGSRQVEQACSRVALVWPALHETFGGQGRDRFADRWQADAEALAHL